MYSIKQKLNKGWQAIRQLSGDDAYERYLAHFAEHHATNENGAQAPQPLSRQAFFKQWQDNQWKDVKRCC